MNTLRCTVVVPCYNEAKRLNVAAFEKFAREFPEICLVFVNDGSKDDTVAVINEIRKRCGSVVLVDKPRNEGKAEAVRTGLLYALSNQISPVVGFWDADLATPLPAILEFLQLLDARPDIDMVFGSRVKLLGRSVERRPIRHYLGRVFATVVSTLLQLPIYDTQCGAKLFRASPVLASVLSEPFLSRWVFDVEIIARLIQKAGNVTAVQSKIYEYPLSQWVDVDGSKVRPKDFLTAFKDVLRIYNRYLR